MSKAVIDLSLVCHVVCVGDLFSVSCASGECLLFLSMLSDETDAALLDDVLLKG